MNNCATPATKINNVEQFPLFTAPSTRHPDLIYVVARGKFLLTAQQARELADRLHDLADVIEVAA